MRFLEKESRNFWKKNRKTIFDSINQKFLPRTHLFLVAVQIMLLRGRETHTHTHTTKGLGDGRERESERESTQWKIVHNTITIFIEQIKIFT